MTKIEIIFKDNTPKECFEGEFEEYYCTNNMFRIECTSGNTYYFSLDNVLRINILEKEKILCTEIETERDRE